MQGIDTEDTDRWFGMFRFVGAEAVGDQRHQTLRVGRQRQVRVVGILAVLLATTWSLLTQGFRDELTDKLVSMRHVGTSRSHRPTVHSERLERGGFNGDASSSMRPRTF